MFNKMVHSGNSLTVRQWGGRKTFHNFDLKAILHLGCQSQE